MKEKPAEVAKRLAKTRGYSYPEWEYLAEKDPVFLDAYNRLSGLSLLHEGFPTEGKQLPAKYRELVAIAAMIGQSRMWGVKPHMERALRLGCTEQELLEALETALTPVGSPPFRQAINILMQVTDWKPGTGKKNTKTKPKKNKRS
ncbi:MAG: putative gamma-carboxymuconolactone decarboxylase subunit [Betaproteobacteria bacterium]|nr:putative gamma-carboxymuconolactone decarboxylase subunit [Betaproteobacteria bacterium]